jgi:hypothetical protein
MTDKPILPPKAVHDIDQRMAQCDRFVDGLIMVYLHLSSKYDSEAATQYALARDLKRRLLLRELKADVVINGLVAAVARMAENERNQGETIDSV